jgi:hypothetical protein
MPDPQSFGALATALAGNRHSAIISAIIYADAEESNSHHPCVPSRVLAKAGQSYTAHG